MSDTIIDNVMDDIRMSEKNADEIIENARDRGKELVLKAQREAETLKEQNKLRLKELKHNSQLELSARVRDRRDATLKRGEIAAKELIDNKNSAVEEAADAVVAMLLESYGE